MVGLTGGIGAGKSVVARRLAQRGAVVIDADRLAREVVAPGTEGLREVVAAFGTGVLDAGGMLDRSALGARVFDDEPARRRLESIIHPRVRARTAQLTAAAAPDAVVVNDVPLLVETGLAATYHLVLVVQASEATRVARLVADRGMTEAQAYARIRAQAGDARRRAAADVVLTNDLALDDLYARVDRLWQERLVPYEENLRLRRPAHDPDRVRLVPYDPTWPAQYARLAARITRAVGPARGAGPPSPGHRVDHIGFTAVPGLPAEDIIDIQLTAGDPAEVDAWADRLAQAGFPRMDQSGAHGSADPARPVRLYLRPAGAPGWRATLLLRDWLRADAVARAGYRAVKDRLTGRDLSRADYTAAKKPWFDAVWPQVQEWARASGWRPREDG